MGEDARPMETTTRKKKYEPTDDDYELSNISISEAENGVVIDCRYVLKEEVKDKMRKNASAMGDSPSFYMYEGDGEKHVFESKQAARDFIMSELDAMWSENVSDK